VRELGDMFMCFCEEFAFAGLSCIMIIITIFAGFDKVYPPDRVVSLMPKETEFDVPRRINLYPVLSIPQKRVCIMTAHDDSPENVSADF
jgi:hypothetical protein